MRPTLEQMGGELQVMVRDRQKLAKILVIQEVSGRQLSKIAGWKSESYGGQLLRGEKKHVSSDAAMRIAKYLGLAVEDLFVLEMSTNPGRSGKPKKAA